MAEPTEERAALERFINKLVTVKTKDGREFRGKLLQHDEHMNLLLEGVEQLSGERVTKHRLMILKGGNISEVSA
jgi:small nuclear ribonucleoprotein (snRNP)-like protein